MDLDKTLKKINRNREKVEACFVFSCWDDPELFEEYQYINTGKDETLTNLDAQFYWTLGLTMYKQGIKSFDAITIESFLKDNSKMRKYYEQYGGYATIDELRSLVNSDNVEAYYDKIARMNSLSTWVKKSDEIFSHVERFDDASNDDIYNAFDLLNNSISLKTGREAEIEDLKITQEFIDNNLSGENVGLNYSENTPLLNYTTLGMPLSDVYLFAGHSGSGKALAITEPVLTPTGFIPMGDIKVGDFVIGEDGKKTRVIGVFPQGKRPAFRITFANGIEIICDAEHLWKVRSEKSAQWLVLKTSDIIISINEGKSWYVPVYNAIRNATTRIKEIQALNDETEMQCIMVDNETCTYVCRGNIVTHNSSFIFENMVLPISKNTPAAILSNEMKIDVYQNMLTSHILTKDLDYWKLTRKKIKIGKYTDEDLEMLKKAQEISKDKYTNIKFVKVFNNDTNMICKYIKKLAHMGVRYIVWDTFKNDDVIDGSDAWLQLLMNSRKIFNLVSKLGIALTCTFQLALYTTNQRFLDASCLSSSKQIKEVVSELVMMRKLWADEYTGCKYDCKPFKYNKDNKKIKEELKLDPEKTYYVCFINKTRNDEGGRQILYRWESAWNRWYEIGYCTIVNDHRSLK